MNKTNKKIQTISYLEFLYTLKIFSIEIKSSMDIYLNSDVDIDMTVF